jgi:hypothetical protein
MKDYHVFFVILRFLVLIQLILVIFKKRIFSPSIKLIIDSVIKLSLGLFIILYFHFNNSGIDPWDNYVLQFAGILIIVDIDFTGLLDIISNYAPDLSNSLSFLKLIQQYRN